LGTSCPKASIVELSYSIADGYHLLMEVLQTVSVDAFEEFLGETSYLSTESSLRYYSRLKCQRASLLEELCLVDHSFCSCPAREGHRNDQLGTCR